MDQRKRRCLQKDQVRIMYQPSPCSTRLEQEVLVIHRCQCNRTWSSSRKMDHGTTTLWNRTEGEISKRKTTSKCRHPFTNTQKTLSSKNSGATKPLKMNAELYYDLVKYLEEEEIREEADEWRRRLL